MFCIFAKSLFSSKGSYRFFALPLNFFLFFVSLLFQLQFQLILYTLWNAIVFLAQQNHNQTCCCLFILSNHIEKWFWGNEVARTKSKKDKAKKQKKNTPKKFQELEMSNWKMSMLFFFWLWIRPIQSRFPLFQFYTEMKRTHTQNIVSCFGFAWDVWKKKNFFVVSKIYTITTWNSKHISNINCTSTNTVHIEIEVVSLIHFTKKKKTNFLLWHAALNWSVDFSNRIFRFFISCQNRTSTFNVTIPKHFMIRFHFISFYPVRYSFRFFFVEIYFFFLFCLLLVPAFWFETNL